MARPAGKARAEDRRRRVADVRARVPGAVHARRTGVPGEPGAAVPSRAGDRDSVPPVRATGAVARLLGGDEPAPVDVVRWVRAVRRAERAGRGAGLPPTVRTRDHGLHGLGAGAAARLGVRSARIGLAASGLRDVGRLAVDRRTGP